MERCAWLNINNPKYIRYHDTEWGVENKNDEYLFEMFTLECFQSGLSWECILNKREAFKKAFDDFDINKIICYDDKKIQELINNPNIIRNKLKIKAAINNAKIFKTIQKDFGSFYNYLKQHCGQTPIIEDYSKQIKSEISDKISKDLKKHGMKFVGSITIYSYLQAIGIINAHGKECFLHIQNTKKQ